MTQPRFSSHLTSKLKPGSSRRSARNRANVAGKILDALDMRMLMILDDLIENPRLAQFQRAKGLLDGRRDLSQALVRVGSRADTDDGEYLGRSWSDETVTDVLELDQDPRMKIEKLSVFSLRPETLQGAFRHLPAI